ncbi:MAG: 5-(carboxyamino)imidazole ribonucleotide mutase [Candidatus Margulisbacteria bacterium]|nr:5-(carboxyamino)imidazole ribonucleotide mutase [Candidatus Margulisiibacteriota bacterium]
MKDVLVIMGSASDEPVLEGCMKYLEKFDLSFDKMVASAHRNPDKVAKIAGSAAENYKVIIAAAGKAAHLPGVIAGHTILPVIGIPIKTSDLGGIDSLYSIVQMPKGVPVATVAINGAENAAILAAQILSLKDEKLKKKLIKFKKELQAG